MKKYIIEQDDREPDFQLLCDCNQGNIEFERKRMKTGDYKYKNMLIERKTIDDFCASILDRRIETQIKKMLTWKDSKDKYMIIIIVGNIKDRKANIHEHCILGKQVSLMFKYGVPILFCEDEFQFLYLLKNLCEKYEKEVLKK